MSFESTDKIVLLTGSAYETNINFFKELVSAEFAPIVNSFHMKTNIPIYQVSHATWIYENCSLNRAHFDLSAFKRECSLINSNLGAIVCLENYNPRAETLVEDIKILRQAFTASFLRTHLFVLITLTIENSKSLRQLREGFEHYDVVFKYLDIDSAKEKKEFVANRVWLMEKAYTDPLRRISRTFFDKNSLHIGNIQSELSVKYEEISRRLGIKNNYAPLEQNYSNKYKNADENNIHKKNELNTSPKAVINQVYNLYDQGSKSSNFYNDYQLPPLTTRHLSGNTNNVKGKIRPRSQSLSFQKTETPKSQEKSFELDLKLSCNNDLPAKRQCFSNENDSHSNTDPNNWPPAKLNTIKNSKYDSVSNSYFEDKKKEKKIESRNSNIPLQSKASIKHSQFKQQQHSIPRNDDQNINIYSSKTDRNYQYDDISANSNQNCNDSKLKTETDSSLLKSFMKHFEEGCYWFYHLFSKRGIHEVIKRHAKEEYLSLLFLGPDSHSKTQALNALKSKDTIATDLKHLVCVEYENERLYMEKLIESGDKILKLMPIDAFVMVVEFDDSENEKKFLTAARMFCKYFGSEAVKSLIVLCVKNINNFGNENLFEKNIRASDGYKYLHAKYPHVSYCMWDNAHTNQRERFYECVSGLTKFTREHMRLALSSMNGQLS